MRQAQPGRSVAAQTKHGEQAWPLWLDIGLGAAAGAGARWGACSGQLSPGRPVSGLLMPMADDGLPRVVVLGGGPAGLHIARTLHARMRRSAHVTLVDRRAPKLLSTGLLQTGNGSARRGRALWCSGPHWPSGRTAGLGAVPRGSQAPPSDCTPHALMHWSLHRKDFFEISWAAVRAHTAPELAERIFVPYKVPFPRWTALPPVRLQAPCTGACPPCRRAWLRAQDISRLPHFIQAGVKAVHDGFVELDAATTQLDMTLPAGARPSATSRLAYDVLAICTGGPTGPWKSLAAVVPGGSWQAFDPGSC